ncbi:hypothetical protein U9M48_006344 [Paspalum notatum var. saurae]|uniref:Reverse transcriptase domain-containing protein n=1 Tax=Paspalum notatum var. saurae TaxID=547442 RepID=A0AAQ3PU55_PASNO
MSASPAADAVQAFVDEITKPVDAVLPMPVVPKRRRKVPPSASAPRRSRRVAGAGPCSPGPVTTDAQRRVIRSLGMAESLKKIPPSAQDEYFHLLDQPLTEVRLAALAAIFGWTVEDEIHTGQNHDSRNFPSVFGSEFNKFVALPATGTRGGVVIAWKSSVCQAVATRVDAFSVSVQFIEQEGRNWWLTGVYGPQDDDSKAEDKNNNNLNRALMGRFRRFLDAVEVKELALIIKKDVMAVLAAIHEGHLAKFKLLNLAFITLIPKKVEALEVKDYRPISLVHSFAKLVTKILANRLAPRLPDMVSINQSAFIKGRTIQDNFLLVQQLAKCLYSKKEPHILLKLDISKAFDSVSWSFLIEILRHLGFGRRWCNMLCLLLSTSSTRVLVNGEPGDVILHLWGLRQGDPLSPMLFILVMEVLHALVVKASRQNLLQPLAVPQARHRMSIYADDVILFLRPNRVDLSLISRLLEVFGHASGLRTNFSKSSIFPINCTETDLDVIKQEMACGVSAFPCKYLGIPLTIRKPTKADLLPLVDKVVDCLPKWKASLLNRARRLVVVKTVFSVIPIHLMTALDLPKWVIKAIDKHRRGFLWSGKEKANGGNCLVSWTNVQRPLQYGGLGIPNLELMGWALRIRWLWLQKIDSDRPWAGLPVHVPRYAQALFDAAIEISIGDGENVLFWTDRWLQGNSVAELAPNLALAIPKKVRKRCSVSQALSNHRWVTDIRGALTVSVLIDYLRIWELVDGIMLQPGVPDQFRWRFFHSGQYSCRSAYQAFFLGAIKFGPWKSIWKSWAPLRCKIFIWLALKNRCWTADRLAKRGLPHPAICPLCDQEQETVQHLLISRVFSHEIWTIVLSNLGMQALSPQPDGKSFSGWWSGAVNQVPKEVKKGLNSLIILVAWEIWKHKNVCVFEGISSSISLVCRNIVQEGNLWCLAGNAALGVLCERLVGLVS